VERILLFLGLLILYQEGKGINVERNQRGEKASKLKVASKRGVGGKRRRKIRGKKREVRSSCCMDDNGDERSGPIQSSWAKDVAPREVPKRGEEMK